MGKNKHSAEMPKSPKRPQIDFKAQQQAQHTATISLIVKNTGKIQKEIGFRRTRLKEVHKKCGFAIEYLNKFKDATWPPPKNDASSLPPNMNISVDLEDDRDRKVSSKDTISESQMSNSNSVSDEVATEVGDFEELEDNVNIGIATVTTEEEEDAREKAEIQARIEGDLDGLEINDDDTQVTQDLQQEQEVQDHGLIRQEVKFALDCYCTTVTHPAATPKMIEIALECIGLLISNRYVVGSTAKKILPKKDELDSFGDIEDGGKDPTTSDVMHLIHCICSSSENPSDAVQSAMTKALLSLMTSPVCSVHEAGMLKSVRTVFHIYLITKHDEVKQMSRSVLLDMLRSVFQRMEAYDAMIKDDEDFGNMNESFELPKNSNINAGVDDGDSNHRFASMFHTDSYLLFRALCKLSAKTLPEDDEQKSMVSSSSGNLKIFSGSKAPSDPMATATKILSLELILSVFEHCGPAFRDGEKFIYAVQNFLCVSLLKNCVSSNTQVAHLSLKVFLLLVYKFKNHMKAEIEVFIANVFLPVLESPNCPFERKSLVLEALRALCVDPMILTSIFLNYDCDFDAVNLYKTIVYHLTSLSVKGRISAPTPTNKTKPFNDKFSLSVAGLEVLVVILQGFLKALDLPGGDDVPDEERSKVRGNLQLDVGMAVKSEMDKSFRNQKSSIDDVPVTAEEMKSIENSSSDATKIVDAFDKKREAQQKLELGLVKFKLSAKQGLLYFIQNGLLQMDAKAIASFFYDHKEVLDKTQIGEIFGREPEASFVKGENIDPDKGGVGFYIRVLHHYVDGLDFTGIKFDDAIRLYLSGFRLPGESQKVDRIMEKFAERFTLQNPEVFPSADTAFILAFAVIMLQTDLHNPNIKPEKKMTEDSFVKMNKGISVDGGDLPVDFLKDIFRSIKDRPFTLKEDEDERNFQTKRDDNGLNDIFGAAGSEERRRQKFMKESAELVESTEKLFKKQKATPTSNPDITSSVNPRDVVKPMFDITWGPLLGALSQILEKAGDESSIALCLNGFVYAVRVASHTKTTLAKNTFVNSLAKFTALGSIRELKTRNIESIRTLLSIAIMDGEHLGESWMPILQCISQLGRLLFFASGVDSDDNFLNSDTQTVATNQTSESRETEEINATVVLEAINEVLIEKVFTSSTQLSDAGILNLIDCLALVSVSEIEGDSKKTISGAGRALQASNPNEKISNESTRKPINGVDGPRVYSLQKLVEVADYNMNSRSRLSWAKIWELMGSHFVKIGCNENAMVSMFAVHALRQLSFKFLEKPELADFNFQRLFLQPFLSIMDNPKTRSDTRELILECVDNTTKAFSQNIRSGWKIFFAILSRSADDASPSNINLGLSILDRISLSHLDDFCYMKNMDITIDDAKKEEKTSENHIPGTIMKERSAMADDFISLCRSSAAFLDSKQIPVTLSMKALCHLARYADKIAEGKILHPLSNTQCADPLLPGYTYDDLSVEEARKMVLWRPIIDGLSAGICASSSSLKGEMGCFVQRGSVITLRSILLRYGDTFTPAQWKAMINQSILPSMNKAACDDKTPVVKIISESPSVSNLDFLTEPLPLPPGKDDEGLLNFAKIRNTTEDGDFLGPMGHAELLSDATLVDLLYRGNRDTSVAHTLLNKENTADTVDEPFSDSWIATTAPLALGMLTDFFCLIGTHFDAAKSKELWPATLGQMQTWAMGSPLRYSVSSEDQWVPCEALVRIGCKEISHLSETVFTLFPRMRKKDVTLWLGTLCESLAETLSCNIELEKELHSDVLRIISEEATGISPKYNGNAKTNINGEDSHENKTVYTAYGVGTKIGERVDSYEGQGVKISIVKLESGATLFGPIQLSQEDNQLLNGTASSAIQVPEGKSTTLSRKEIMKKYISPLRVRCTSIYCVQQSLFGCLEMFASNCSKDEISLLLDALESSRSAAASASVDKALSAYFEEAMRLEWGGKLEEPQAAFSSTSGVGHLGRCEMFFLTQEASASNVIVRLLSLLYCPGSETDQNDWDTVEYSEHLLLVLMTDIMKKFIVSERENGHKLDPNVWRVASDCGTKFAIPCTSFAVVVVNILYTILGFTDEQFDRQKATLFPILCSLILIQSEEIRMLVAKVLNTRVSVLLGIS